MSQPAGPAARAPSWRDDLTPMHWRVLKAGFLGWIFDGFEAFALFVILKPALKTLLSPEQLASPALYAGTAIGITLLGWGVGGLVGGTLADYVGRKPMMLWSVFLYGALSGLTAFSQTFTQLCVLRFLTGLAMGSEWSTGISLLAETWPERARAKGAGFLQSGFGWGTLLAAVTWAVLSNFQPLGADTWRLMFLVGGVPAFFVLYIRRGIDESEKWQQAVRERRWSATVQDDMGGHADRTGTRRPFTLGQLFSEPEARRRTIIATLLSTATTIGWWGISSWLPTYTAGIAKAQGLANPDAWGREMSIFYTVGAVVAYLLSGFIIDALGRRWFIFLTFLGALLSTVVTYALTSSITGLFWIVPINGFFTLGCAYVWMATYPAELFSTTVRSTAASFIFNAARMIAWVFPIIAGSIIKSFGGVAHAALTLGSIYVLGLTLPWFLPETTGHGMPD